MKLYEFLSLDDELQYQAIWQHGVHIDDVIYEKLHYQLSPLMTFMWKCIMMLSPIKL